MLWWYAQRFHLGRVRLAPKLRLGSNVREAPLPSRVGSRSGTPRMASPGALVGGTNGQPVKHLVPRGSGGMWRDQLNIEIPPHLPCKIQRESGLRVSRPAGQRGR